MTPVGAYLSIPEIIRVAKLAGADAIHPGYGLLSENPDFVEACNAAGIVFIGPKTETIRAVWDKASARRVAVAAGVPVIPATEVLGDNFDLIKKQGGRSWLSADAQSLKGRGRSWHARHQWSGRSGRKSS